MIVLIRHGDIGNARGRAIGQTDLPLSNKGEMQAAALAGHLNGLHFKTIFCSPLIRTRQTAEPLKNICSTPPVFCQELAEIDLGEWDGLGYDRIKADFPEEYRKRGEDLPGYRPPGGENFLDLEKRVTSGLELITNENLPALVVTHAGVIRIILHLVLGFPLENIFRIRPEHCHASVLLKKGNDYTLKGYNMPPGPDLNRFLNGLVS